MGEAVEAAEGVLQRGGHERASALAADDEPGAGEAVERLADRPPAHAELGGQLQVAGEGVAVAARGDPVRQHPLELVVQRERRGGLQGHGFSLGTL